MTERKPSLHIVTVFDPHKDPSVAEMLQSEIRDNPTVISLFTLPRKGLVSSKKGTFWMDDAGEFSKNTVESKGCKVFFRRRFADGTEDDIPFATALYSLEECLACATGEVVRLDEFIERSAFGDINFDMWERELSKSA